MLSISKSLFTLNPLSIELCPWDNTNITLQTYQKSWYFSFLCQYAPRNPSSRSYFDLNCRNLSRFCLQTRDKKSSYWSLAPWQISPLSIYKNISFHQSTELHFIHFNLVDHWCWLQATSISHHKIFQQTFFLQIFQNGFQHIWTSYLKSGCINRF